MNPSTPANIRCMIVDDELMAHQILERYILQTPGLTLVAKCRNALEAFSNLERNAIDLIFLDIEMPLVNGLSFLKTLQERPAVILTTAYAAYALEGYELDVIDYLLKPFSLDRFTKAVNKYRKTIHSATPSAGTINPTNPSNTIATANAISGNSPTDSHIVPQPINPNNPHATAASSSLNTGIAAPSTAAQPTAAGHLLVREKNGIAKLPYERILYIEASRDYMKVVTSSQPYLVHITMKQLEEQLPPGSFIRVHKSYIVAIPHIRIVRTDSLLLTGETEIPVSPNYKDKLLEVFKK